MRGRWLIASKAFDECLRDGVTHLARDLRELPVEQDLTKWLALFDAPI